MAVIGESDQGANLRLESRKNAGVILNVSERLVDDAVKVQREATPEVVQAVETGQLAVSAAAKLADAAADVQKRVLERRGSSPAVIRWHSSFR
jgi:hypothetical protein